MKKSWRVGLVCITAFIMASVFSRSRAKDAAPSKARSSIQPKQLVGDWYMGTMTGFDCNLKISSNQKLSVQFRDCFSRGALLQSRWKLDGDKIRFQNDELRQSLGSYLRVVRYKKHLVLLPERRQSHGGEHKYSYRDCFWRIPMPKDAPQ